MRSPWVLMSTLLTVSFGDARGLARHMQSVVNVAVNCGAFRSCIACAMANTACRFVDGSCVAGADLKGPTCSNTVASLPLQCNEKGGGYWLTIDDKRAICLSHTECGELARIGLKCDPFLRRKVKLSLPKIRAGNRPVTVRVNGRAVDLSRTRDSKKKEKLPVYGPAPKPASKTSVKSRSRSKVEVEAPKTLSVGSKTSNGPQSQILPSMKLSDSAVAPDAPITEIADLAAEVEDIEEPRESKKGVSQSLMKSMTKESIPESTPTRFSISEGGSPNRSEDDDDVIRFVDDEDDEETHSISPRVSSDAAGPGTNSRSNQSRGIAIKIRSGDDLDVTDDDSEGEVTETDTDEAEEPVAPKPQSNSFFNRFRSASKNSKN